MILVTGATGLLGTNLVRMLVDQGRQVRILRREHSNMAGLEDLDIEHACGDVRDYAAVLDAMQGCRQVYHTAATASLSPFVAVQSHAINVVGTENIVRAVREVGIERLVYTSSAVTVGYGPLDRPADEQSSFNLGAIDLPYFTTKKQAEEVVLAACRQGLPAVVVNPHYMLGPWDKHPKMTELLSLVANGELPFYFSGGLGISDAQDIAAGHIAAMDKGKIGERYLLNSDNLSFLDLFEQFCGCAGCRPPTRRMPYPLLAMMGWFPKQVARITGKEPDMSPELARVFSLPFYVSADKARRELGYAPRPLSETLERALEWMVAQGMVSR